MMLSAWGWTLLWVAARATVLALVGAGAYAWARRRGPGAASATALASLSALALVAALGVVPWPGWRIWWAPTPVREAATVSEPEPEPKPEPRRAASFGGAMPVGRLWGTPAAATPESPTTLDADAIVSGGPEVVFAWPGVGRAEPEPKPSVRERIQGLLAGLGGPIAEGSTPRRLTVMPTIARASSKPEPDSELTRREAIAPPIAKAPEPPGWPDRVAAGLAGAFVLGLTWELLRLGAGLWAVRRLRRRSRPVLDAESLDTLADLRGALGLRRRVELRSAPEVACPATVGWLGPLVLVPGDWSSWPSAERRAVLAHELAHVKRHDYAGWLLARLCLATHFYHPMAHWLAGRLRLEQELAADAEAARLVGGRRAYLAALATLALRQDQEHVSAASGLAWPARPFFPRLGTLVRRIEMLRTATDEPRRGLSALMPRVVTYGLLLGAGFVLAGLRSPHSGSEAKADAQGEAQAKTALARGGKASESLGLEYVPDDAALVVSVRPSAFLQRSELRALLDAVRQQEEVARFVGLLDPDSIEQVTAVLNRSAARLLVEGGDDALLLSGGLIVRTRTARDWKSAISGMLPAAVVESRHAGQVYHSIMLDEAVNVGFFQPDDRTLVVAMVPILFGYMQPKREGAEHRWAEAWRQVAGGEITVVADVGTLAGPFLPLLAKANTEAGEATLIFGTVAPLWEETESLALGLSFADGLGLKLVASCGDEAGAKRVERTLQAVLTLGENASRRFFPLIRREALGGDNEAAAFLTAIDLGEQLLDGAEARRDGSTVRMDLDSKVDLGALVRLALMLL